LPSASTTRDSSINLDASDPDFASRLSQIGPVQPNPTFSPSSTFSADPTRPQHMSSGDPSTNPAVSLLTARYRLAQEADEEFSNLGRRGSPGRSFLDVVTLRQVLMLRDEKGVSEGEIEKKLELKKGTVGKLGGKGVVGIAGY